MNSIFLTSLFGFLVLLASCRQEKTVSVNYDAGLGYRVEVNSSDLEGVEKLSLVTISESGERNPDAQTVEFSEQGTLELSIPESSFYVDRYEGLAEKRSAFGFLPSEDLGPEFDYDRKLTSRFELYDPDQIERQSVIHYLQMMVDYENRAVLNAEKSEARWNFSYVGVVEVLLKGFDGKALPDGFVSLIPHDKQGPMKPWSQQVYRPVLTRTNEEGRARLFPVPIGIDGAGFQIVASAPEFCTFVTEVYPSSKQIGQVIEVNLKPCDLRNVDSYLPSKPQLSFDNSILNGNGFERFLEKAYLNQSQLKVRVDYFGENIRPLLVNLNESENLRLKPRDDKPLASLKQDWPSGFVVFDIKKFMNEGKVTEFAVDAQLDLNSRELERMGGSAQKVKAFASVLKRTPKLKMEQFLVQSSVNEWNVISGQEKETFLVSTAGCPDGQYGSVALFEIHEVLPKVEDLHFVPCRTSLVRYSSKDLGLADKNLGGIREFGVVGRDRFGNISPIEAEKSIKIYVDFGSPDLAGEQPVAMGLKDADVFQITRKSGGNSSANLKAYQISVDDLGKYEVGFRNEKQCLHSNPSLADGPEAIGNRGQLIHDWALADELSAVLSPKKRNRCKDKVKLNDLIKNTSMIDSQGYLMLYLQVRDQAGHISNVQSIKIEVCQEGSLPQESHGYCIVN